MRCKIWWQGSGVILIITTERQVEWPFWASSGTYPASTYGNCSINRNGGLSIFELPYLLDVHTATNAGLGVALATHLARYSKPSSVRHQRNLRWWKARGHGHHRSLQRTLASKGQTNIKCHYRMLPIQIEHVRFHFTRQVLGAGWSLPAFYNTDFVLLWDTCAQHFQVFAITNISRRHDVFITSLLPLEGIVSFGEKQLIDPQMR